MKDTDKTSPRITNEDYGNAFLSVLMGTATVVGIWYFSGILLVLVKNIFA